MLLGEQVLLKFRTWVGYRWVLLRADIGFRKFLIKQSIGDYAPKWSQLNTIGKSRAVAMTALVPFIGSYILFNKNIYEYLGLVPEASLPGSFWSLSTIERLYILYFGLCILGIASILFKAGCPGEIKQFSNIHEFVVTERPLSTVPRLTMMIVSIAKHFLIYRTEDLEEKARAWRQIGFSENLWNITYQSFNEIAHEVAANFEDLRDEEGKASHFFDHRDNMYLERWMEFLASPPTVLRNVAGEFYRKSSRHDIDILSIYFLSLDQRRPLLILFVAILYTVGFILLAIPTLSTFASIVQTLSSK